MKVNSSGARTINAWRGQPRTRIHFFVGGGGGGGEIVTREKYLFGGAKLLKFFRGGGGGENDPSPATESEKVDGLMIQDTSFLEFIYLIFFFFQNGKSSRRKKKNRLFNGLLDSGMSNELKYILNLHWLYSLLKYKMQSLNNYVLPLREK